MLRNMKSSKHFQIMWMPMLLHLHFRNFRDVMRRELDSNVIKKAFETEDEYHFFFSDVTKCSRFVLFSGTYCKRVRGRQPFCVPWFPKYR